MPKQSSSIPAKEPFCFYTRLHLTELIGLKAATIGEFRDLLKQVPGASIYHHTHRFLQQHQQWSPEPPNDFAYWAVETLGDALLSEKLASIDTVQFATIRQLRDKLVLTVEEYLKNNPLAAKRFAPPGEEFYFMKSISFVLATKYMAHDLNEFISILEKITIDSIYYHIFEARLRLEKKANDFAYWVETSLGRKDLAVKISKMDPYTQTLEDLRRTMIQILKKG